MCALTYLCAPLFLQDDEELGRKRRRGGAAAGPASAGSGGQRLSRSRKAGGSASNMADMAAGGSGGYAVEASTGTMSRRSRRGKGTGDVDAGGSYSYCSLEDEEDVDCMDNGVRGRGGGCLLGNVRAMLGHLCWRHIQQRSPDCRWAD